MKQFCCLISILILCSCQVTETIHINSDGSGTIETMTLRDEPSYMQLVGQDYSKEDKFIDTTYVFKEYIMKYSENFYKLPLAEKEIFNKFGDVTVHIKKSSYDKEFRTKISQKFEKIEAVPDLYKTEEYADDLQHNYALSAEEHYYNVSYAFDGTIFKRIVVISDPLELKKQQARILALTKQLAAYKINQPYTLKYYFPRKIKSVSNSTSKISEDKRALTIQFLLADCLQNPEITSLEVILE